MTKHPAHDAQRRQWMTEQLLAPDVRKLCKPSKGKSVSSILDEDDFIFLSDEDLVTSWIKSGANLNNLARFLEERPYLLDRELIRNQLFHLHALAREFMPVADTLFGVAADKTAAAQTVLKRIAESLVRGLLPGYTVRIAANGPNGRPRAVEHKKLLQDLKGLLRALDALMKRDSFYLLRKTQENHAVFTRRIAQLAQHLYQNCHLSFRASIPPYKPFLDGKGQPNVNLDPHSLDLVTAWNIAKRAIQKRKTASFKLLVLGILKYDYHVSLKAMESHLARATRQYPKDSDILRTRFPQFFRN